MSRENGVEGEFECWRAGCTVSVFYIRWQQPREEPISVATLSARSRRLGYSLTARFFYPMTRRVRKQGLTYLSNERLISLARLANQLVSGGNDPLFVEFGVALGGSSIVVADIFRRAGRGKVVGYDMFGLIPAPSENDGEDARQRFAEIASGRSKGLKGQTYYGYETGLLAKVAQSFERFGLRRGDHFELVAGDFRQSFRDPGRQIDLMHIDCDWHDSVAFCLEQARLHLRPGGFAIIDDYNDYEGCARAVDAFLSARGSGFVLLRNESHAVLQRNAAQIGRQPA